MTPRGKAMELANQEKRNRLCLPRQANGEKRGGSSSATGAFNHLTPRGKAMELDINLSTGFEVYKFLNKIKTKRMDCFPFASF
ncbi:hypothetical protein M3627_04980 [Psychrobacillus sp. MER TA 171]|nr:hypothetical protein [Psychrobacillus sp. MER TA 171]